MIAKMFCDTFGLRCKLYENKIDLAKTTDINIIVEKAEAIKG